MFNGLISNLTPAPKKYKFIAGTRLPYIEVNMPFVNTDEPKDIKDPIIKYHRKYYSSRIIKVDDSGIVIEPHTQHYNIEFRESGSRQLHICSIVNTPDYKTRYFRIFIPYESISWALI
jgi:hypothetical protein